MDPRLQAILDSQSAPADPVTQLLREQILRGLPPPPGLPNGVRALPQATQAIRPQPQAPVAAPANGGQISGPQAQVPSSPSSPAAPSAPSPVRRGPAVVPRVQLDPATPPSSPLSQSIAAQRGAYNTQLDKLMQPADYSRLSQQMRDRSRGGMDDMYASVLAGLGPSAVRPMQEPLLKQALAAKQPMNIEGGQVDAEGRVMLDPSFQRNKIADQLRNRLVQLDQLEARITNDQDKAALAHERNMILLMMQQMRLDMSQMNMGASTYGFTQEGHRIVEDRQGNQYVINPDGSRTRFMGQGIPKAAYEKNVQGAMGLQGNVNRADNLISLADKNPEAFGLAAAAVSLTPDIIQQRVMPKVLTPEQLMARNYIQKAAAQEIHEIYGAALTMGEGHRASSWAIGPRDSAESTLAKLKAARAWAAQAMTAQGAAANVQAQGRVNPGGVPPVPQGVQPPAGNPPSSGGLPPGWGYRTR